MTVIERQSFRNYFWTAQLIGGLSLGGKMLFTDGALAAVAVFVLVMPFAALAAWLRMRWERKHPPNPNPRMPSVRFVLISVGIVALALAGTWFAGYGW